MSTATPTTQRHPSRRTLVLGLSALTVWLAYAPLRKVWAQEAKASRTPAVLSAYGTDWKAKGSGVLKFFGFKAYDATLWLTGDSGGQFSFNRAFALEIVYNTYIKASDINNTSLIEMARISGAMVPAPRNMVSNRPRACSSRWVNMWPRSGSATSWISSTARNST